ncbi:hypothetical protein [Paludibaculum fermentans]|uniref:hypothetical protein n=1 Tax=Paludibaculum fermentans TaxID=1473598 RepID=UPI003EBFF80B
MEPYDPMEPNEELESSLRQALEREDAPEWFAEGVMARVRSEGMKPRRTWLAGWLGSGGGLGSGRWMRWAAAVATVALVFGGVRWEQQRRQQVQGEAAKAQLMMALRMTGEKLRVAQVRVQSLERDEQAQ